MYEVEQIFHHLVSSRRLQYTVTLSTATPVFYVVNASFVCKRWYAAAQQEGLWEHVCNTLELPVVLKELNISVC